MLPALLAGNPAFLRVASQLVFIPTLVYTLCHEHAQLLLAAPALTAARRYGRALGISVLQIGVLLLAAVVCIAVLTVQVLNERPDLRPAKASERNRPNGRHPLTAPLGQQKARRYGSDGLFL